METNEPEHVATAHIRNKGDKGAPLRYCSAAISYAMSKGSVL